ncbi:hypothetical protein RUND412_011631, partial [Rhizina undulata]
MSASSGVRGFCQACNHANNEHNYRQCEAPGCTKRWKLCQVTTGCEQPDRSRKICKRCPIHDKWKPADWE